MAVLVLPVQPVPQVQRAQPELLVVRPDQRGLLDRPAPDQERLGLQVRLARLEQLALRVLLERTERMGTQVQLAQPVPQAQLDRLVPREQTQQYQDQRDRLA